MSKEHEQERTFSPADAVLIIASFRLLEEPGNQALSDEYNKVTRLHAGLPQESDERENTANLNEIYHKYVNDGYLLPFDGELADRKLSRDEFALLFTKKRSSKPDVS